ncbi:MAG: cisplatin damage response ATP-dependent DNA ligase, partial [Pseudomonadota bacterium]
MTPFSQLLTGLVFTPGRNAKLTLLQRYFDAAPDPDRGWALAAVCGALDLRAARPSLIRGLVEERVDPVLFRLSYDYVGDLAETVSLIWPTAREADAPPPSLSQVIEALRGAGRSEMAPLLAGLFDRLPAEERFALVKLATGGLRVGVSARLAKTALSQWAASRGVPAPVEAIEELWHGLEAPYEDLFAWLSGAAPEPPAVDLSLAFRPMMLAHPIDQGLYAAEELRENQESESETLRRLEARLAPAAFAAEWKWDGIRVQAVATAEAARLYSRTGEEVSGAFPDLAETLRAPGCLDGELLVIRDGVVRPFAELQRRLGRKTVSAKLLREAPAWIRAYDLLQDGEEDLRGAPFSVRRARLEQWIARHRPERIARHARVLAVLGFVVANLCALVGSLFGDYVGETIWG